MEVAPGTVGALDTKPLTLRTLRRKGMVNKNRKKRKRKRRRRRGRITKKERKTRD